MIIRDSRTPFGRQEDGPPSQDFARLNALSLGLGILNEGETWMTLNKRVDNRMAKAAERGRQNAIRYGKTCGICKVEFLGNFKSKYCTDRCRQRAKRQRRNTT